MTLQSMMEEISFSDWPGQPVDLSSSNPWLPAYGFQQPHALLDKNDFIGNPDAEFFFQDTVGQHYMYLETIQEETSDDLQSESDISESRFSPVGWLATDSEAGSVIRIDNLTIDDVDCESDREMACPAKRMRQDANLLGFSDDDSTYSLSRSSSLLQFETLERQCQDISSSSPSIFSTFSYDSLENQRKHDVSPDSLEDDDVEPVSDYYKNIIKVDLAMRPKFRDTLLSDSDSSESTDSSERTLSNAFISTGSLKISRSFDDLHRDKISAENLSEDSGYSDHILNKSSSIPNLFVALKRDVGGDASCCEIPFSNNTISSNFGSSFQDLSVLDKYDGDFNLIERFMRVKSKWTSDFAKRPDAIALNIETECEDRSESKYNNTVSSSSEPNLLLETFSSSNTSQSLLHSEEFQNYYSSVSSVPKDLNLAGNLTRFFRTTGGASVAAKNCDIADLKITSTTFNNSQYLFEKKFTAGGVIDMASFKRESSYQEAMSNRVDLSDDENNPCYRDKSRQSTIVEFDKQILKTISETSIPCSFNNNMMFTSTPIRSHSHNRNVVSTPNLTVYNDTTSTSEDETNLITAKSYSGSSSSKGVHFCPVVAEVKWRDDSDSTANRDSPSSLSSSTPPIPDSPPLIRPKPRMAPLSRSEPSLQKQTQTEEQAQYSHINLTEQPQYIPLKPRVIHSSESGGGLQRRGSKVVQKDDEGNVLAAYVDSDGVQYKHIHLGDVYKSMPPTPTGSHVLSNTKSIKNATESTKRAMEPPVKAAVVNSARRDSNKTSKLGGFFSRLASFRFSTRNNKNNVSDSKNNNKNAAAAVSTTTSPTRVQAQHQQRLATKDDYIYIPLKGPEDKTTPIGVTDNNQQVLTKHHGACVSAKPPLPKMLPPRVVSASVKKGFAQEASSQMMRPGYPTNIDSGDALPRLMEPMGLIETDLDTEVTVITSGANVKTRSLMNLGAEAPKRSLAAPPHPDRPHKSMEFLLDKQNLKVVEPPENELQKGERVMSEHQLRIQRSLQKLTIPDWYKQSPVPREGFLLKKNTTRERWTGTASKTPSLNSLCSNNPSPIMLSPSPHNLQPFVRWSTSKLNSTASSPCASTRSSFNARQPNGSISPSSIRSSFSYRQPYLGWRSQERLARPRTPAERLASSLLAQNQNNPVHQPESPEIQTSIKEVTSAIVHYVSGLTPEISEPKSVSPRGSQKLCWMESSFVGTRPVDIPETPVSLAENHNSTSSPPISNLRLELQKTHNDVSNQDFTETTKPSPSSTTLEDVLDSLLGLPPSTRAPSPSHQETASANTSPSHLGQESRAAEQFRRHSEGSEPVSRQSSVPRRVSFHSSPVLRCRYTRCSRVVLAASSDAQSFKSCHNCSYTYCSRTCRRAHWEKHRKSCLFSRVGSLCRQVLAASKEQHDTLLQISLIARRGYLSQGLGAVKCFFPRPEAAEKFLKCGLSCLGELTYVRWTDLLPTEMGTQMYTELVKMCKNYNPDSKLVLYITVCVISEVPETGSVKWERQLVSRCAKMRLSKDVPIPERDTTENLETLVLTCLPTPNIKCRETVFSNIQTQLKIRGISLRRQYPEIYRQLCMYVEGKCRHFIPVTVYPRDDITGKSFMCIIMLDCEAEGVRQVSAAGVRLNTVNLLQNCDF